MKQIVEFSSDKQTQTLNNILSKDKEKFGGAFFSNREFRRYILLENKVGKPTSTPHTPHS